MPVHSVVGVYQRLDEAEAAVRSLSDGGFPIEKVSIIAQHLEDDWRSHGNVTACDAATSAATTGAWVGGIFGLLVGVAFLWVPGMRPLFVAGSLAAVLLGGIEGAVAGGAVSGVLGWLFSAGITREKLARYEEAIQTGGFLLVAHGSADEVDRAHAILADSEAEQLDLHPSATARPEHAGV
jgi:hypothetical protein